MMATMNGNMRKKKECLIEIVAETPVPKKKAGNFS